MTLAQQYFDAIDANDRLGLHTADDLWKWIGEGGTLGLTHGSWKLNGSRDTYFRGQPSTAFGLSSKLYRDCREAGVASGYGDLTEDLLARAERTLLETLSDEGIGRRMSDGEKLMLFQHHGIATRLLDVSATPKEALFFACDQAFEQPGRLFIIALPSINGRVNKSMRLGEALTLPWLGSAIGRKYAAGHWTELVAVVTDDALDPRMRAQNGRFLVGGLAKRYSGKTRLLAGVNLKGREHTEICTLDINFLRKKTQKHSDRWGASGWCVKVEAE